jgi:hypothetical protein
MNGPMNPRHGRLAAWVAVLAMALNALWPLVAQAKPRSVTLVPVCTIGGETHYQELPAGKTPLEQQTSSHQEHCSYCSLSALPSQLVFLVSEKSVSSEPEQVEPLLVETRKTLTRRPRAPPFLLSMSSNDDHHRRIHEEASDLRLPGDGRAGRGDLRLGVLHD